MNQSNVAGDTPRLEVVARGVIFQCKDPSVGVAILPRVVLLEDGELICSFCVVPKLGINASKTYICRSSDSGHRWSHPTALWPHLFPSYSLCLSASRGHRGRLHMYGMQTPIGTPDELGWSDETKGLRANNLAWATSIDNGRSWSALKVIPMTQEGAAESPGPICETRDGILLAPYSPYRTFDPNLHVKTNRVIAMRSGDDGRSWQSIDMLVFPELDSGAAEAWATELSDGQLLGAAWHTDPTEQRSYCNAYAMSLDQGATWTSTSSTGIDGNTVALTPLPRGGVLFCYVKRKQGDSGIGVAIANPTSADFNIKCNEMLMTNSGATQTGNDATSNNWNDFAFGEPSITLLSDDTFLLCYWCVEQSFKGIRYLRVRMTV